MVQLLDQNNKSVAKKIRDIFQASYSVEAELLQALNFPPLQRKLSDILKCETSFYGFYIDQYIAAVVEIKNNTSATHIQSLVVDPTYFRKGIAEQLMLFVLEKYKTPVFTVETGLANIPAVQLYKKLGFTETSQYNTNHEIRKVRLQKQI